MLATGGKKVKVLTLRFRPRCQGFRPQKPAAGDTATSAGRVLCKLHCPNGASIYFNPDVDMNLMGNHEENIRHRTSSKSTSKTTILDVKKYHHRHRLNPIDTDTQITDI